MQIPVVDPMGGYPQPYATWAALRNDAEVQGDAGAVNDTADSRAEQSRPSYTVDYTA
jgi:hypothetical protein